MKDAFTELCCDGEDTTPGFVCLMLFEVLLVVQMYILSAILATIGLIALLWECCHGE